MFFRVLYSVDLLLNSVIRFHFSCHQRRISFVLQICRAHYCDVILDVFHNFVFCGPSAERSYQITRKAINAFRDHRSRISFVLQISRANYCEVVLDVVYSCVFYRPSAELGYQTSFHFPLLNFISLSSGVEFHSSCRFVANTIAR